MGFIAIGKDVKRHRTSHKRQAFLSVDQREVKFRKLNKRPAIKRQLRHQIQQQHKAEASSHIAANQPGAQEAPEPDFQEAEEVDSPEREEPDSPDGISENLIELNGTFKSHQPDRSISILERLPRELLRYIFILAGPNNNLNLLNKNLYQEFNFQFRQRSDYQSITGVSFLHDFLRHNFTFNINRNLQTETYVNSAINVLKSHNIDVPEWCNAKSIQKSYFFQSSAIDVRAFNYRFIHPDIFDHNDFFCFLRMTPDQIDMELQYRDQYIKYRVWENLLGRVITPTLQAREIDHTNEESITGYRSLELEQQRLTKLVSGLRNDLAPYFTMKQNRPRIPVNFFDNLDGDKMQIVLQLCHSSFVLPSDDRFFNQILDRHPETLRLNYISLLRMGAYEEIDPPATYQVTTNNIIKLFRKINDIMIQAGIDTWRPGSCSIPRHIIPVDEWFEFLNHCVAHYYTRDEDDGPVWEALRDCKEFLLDYLMGYSVPPLTNM